MHIFLSKKKLILLSYAHTFFMHIFKTYTHLSISINTFLMRIFKMSIKFGAWKHSNCLIIDFFYSEETVQDLFTMLSAVKFLLTVFFSTSISHLNKKIKGN